MPIRVPVHTIMMRRDGKRFTPPVGKPFNFTAEEVAEIAAVSPRALRKPINETIPDDMMPPKGARLSFDPDKVETLTAPNGKPVKQHAARTVNKRPDAAKKAADTVVAADTVPAAADDTVDATGDDTVTGDADDTL